jgi:hypothetical protein
MIRFQSNFDRSASRDPVGLIVIGRPFLKKQNKRPPPDRSGPGKYVQTTTPLFGRTILLAVLGAGLATGFIPRLRAVLLVTAVLVIASGGASGMLLAVGGSRTRRRALRLIGTGFGAGGRGVGGFVLSLLAGLRLIGTGGRFGVGVRGHNRPAADQQKGQQECYHNAKNLPIFHTGISEFSKQVTYSVKLSGRRPREFTALARSQSRMTVVAMA